MAIVLPDGFEFVYEGVTAQQGAPPRVRCKSCKQEMYFEDHQKHICDETPHEPARPFMRFDDDDEYNVKPKEKQ